MGQPQTNVLVFNCGSSSLKFALIDANSGYAVLSDIAERLGTPGALMTYRTGDAGAEKQLRDLGRAKHAEAVAALMDILAGRNDFVAVGHRVVHGGEEFQATVQINKEVKAQIRRLFNLAPLHNPANLVGIEIAEKYMSQVPHFAVFDTAFHQTMPPHAFVYAIPYEYLEVGIRRYGFHGTSHRFVAKQAATQLNLPLEQTQFITAHLGNGCSLCAVREGKSVDTTMGFTPLEGLMMGTRSGDVDPGLLQYLCEINKEPIQEIVAMLNQESGLLGVSGLSNDMRTLVAEAEKGHQQAHLAIELFCYRLAKSIASMHVALTRTDALIFTGGIGENAAVIRRKTLTHLENLGYGIDDIHNENHGNHNKGIISRDNTRLAMVIPTNEEWMIAQECLSLLPSDTTVKR